MGGTSSTKLMSPDITTLTPLFLINPFLALIRSPLTSGPITALALTSLHSLLLSLLPPYLSQAPTTIQPSTPLQIALAHVSATLSSCRFPSSSPQQDELVQLRLLRVTEVLLIPMPCSQSLEASFASSSKASTWVTYLDHMSDESVCELLEAGLALLARARLGEGIRNMAQSCVQGIVRAAFGKLNSTTKEDVERLFEAVKEEESKTMEVEEAESAEIHLSDDSSKIGQAEGTQDTAAGIAAKLSEVMNGAADVNATSAEDDG
jgi:brefeldin A-resistance guanine nucleotide exchange factor 1